ncbi:DMT family transporter [Ensifer soli]|uniref:DMT family transporter n=1 Tax=Ciceribacter sp. sgz301302 TaxID=3342379 RepID=UPI0035B7068A
MSPQHDAALHRRGILITGLGGLALSFDIPLIHAAGGNIWSVVALRSTCTFVTAILIWLVMTRLMNWRISLLPGRAGLLAGILYGVDSLVFFLAVFNTSTANVVFILAFTSMFSAFLSWIFLKERPSNATLVTMAAMVVGVGIIVRGGLESGHLFGDAMALLAAFLLAAAITASRASRADMGLVPLITTIIPATVGFIMISGDGLQIAHPAFTLFNGIVIIPLAFYCLATGPRFLTGPEVAMFYLLETVLAPIWVWLFFSEEPSRDTLVGGAILIAALVGHSLWQMARRPRAVPAP